MERSEPLARPLLDFGVENTPIRLKHVSASASSVTPSSSSKIAGEAHAPAQGRKARPCWPQLKHAFLWLGRKSWTAEVLSYLFSVLSLVGLVMTLAAHQDRRLPDWPQLVTINSIVSLFSLLMRAGVGFVLAEGISQSKWRWFRKARKLADMEYFDSASRGPWGSIILLYKFRSRRAYYIAALGAIATILVSLTGFFSQQLIQFKDCLQQDDTASVLVSRTNNYTAAGQRLASTSADRYQPLVDALNVGLIQPVKDTTGILSRGCETGNCTFPSTNGSSFSTLAIGHTCKDVTAQLQRRNVSARYSPTNVTWTMLDLGGWQNSIGIEEQESTVLATSTVGYLSDVSSAIATLYVIFRPNSTVTEFSAINCSLYPAVNTYGINITKTVLEENLVKSVLIPPNLAQFGDEEIRSIGGDKDKFWYSHKMALAHTYRNGVRESCDGSKNPGPGLVQFFKNLNDISLSNDLSLPKNITQWYYPTDCLWAIGALSTAGIGTYFNDIFSGQTLNRSGRGGTQGSIQLTRLYREGNMSFATVDGTMGDIAQAMTMFIRTHGEEGPSAYVEGKMWYTTTCMYIRWSWIIFPAAMIGLTGVFLILVAIENRDVAHDRLWKSSILASLFCEVDFEVFDKPKPTCKQEMIDIAKSTSVSLEGSTGTLKLLSRRSDK